LGLPLRQSGQRPRIRVLVVDDDEMVRKFTARVLVDAGYDVVLACDAIGALQLAKQQGPFDLCVVDLMMSVMNGDEVARLLRRDDPDIKILFFTGYSDRLFKQTETLSPNEAFLDKPAGIQALVEAVSLLLISDIKRATQAG
jgi:two-component system, cell cycle sensor histidine kinase and response regulator CckA